MIKKISILGLILFTINFSKAAGPPGDAQIYDLVGDHNNQVIMLSNWAEGKIFSEFEDYRKSALKYFSENQQVWIWCQGEVIPNKIEKIHTYGESGMTLTTVSLSKDTSCNKKPLLMSNYEIPKQTWKTSEISQQEIKSIHEKLATKEKLKITKIKTQGKGIFFLVFDPSIPAIYDSGGYRLLNAQLTQLSMVEGHPLTPLVDLDNDSVPEFFIPSSDGMGAWLYKLFPNLERDISHQYKVSK